MSKKLEDPYYYQPPDDNTHDDYDSDDSFDESPLVNKVKQFERPQDLSFLASANFSTDSIAEADEDLPGLQQQYNPYNFEGGNTSGPVSDESSQREGFDAGTPVSNHTFNFNHGRRLSLNSPTSILRPNTNASRPRPKSAIIFADDVDSPLKSPSQSRSGRRRSNNYAPPPIIAPPNASRSSSPTRPTSPTRMNRHFRSKSPVRRLSSPSKTNNYQPFNFKSQEVMNNGNNGHLTVKPAHRKGHKYKHSSVSMNYFQEPDQSFSSNQMSATSSPFYKQQQQIIPDKYPIPTFKESIKSITANQKFKLGWSMIHLSLSLIVFTIGNKINVAELGTLAHLIFYDSLGSLVIIFVDIMSNFEVWNHSSIMFPFGLSRLEVLIGFSLGASLIMVGFDLLSHIFEEFILFLFQMDDENNHSHHIHSSSIQPNSQFIYFTTLLVTICVTLVTSNYILAAEKINKILKGHNRGISNIGLLNDEKFPKIDRFEKFNKFTNIITKNPTYVLTLIYTTFLIMSPIISDLILKNFEVDINELASLIISLLFVLTGWKLVQALGSMLLLSYPSSEFEYNKLKLSIINDLENLDSFKTTYKIEHFHITKFNYEIFIIGIKLIMMGSSIDEESIIKHEINKLIKLKLSRRQKKFKLELTIDIDR